MTEIRRVVKWIEDELKYKSDFGRSQTINTYLSDISTDNDPILDRVIAENVAGIRSQLSNPPNMVMDYEIRRHLDNIKVQLDLLGQ